MSELATALKEEIRRLARKEIRAQTTSTKQAVAQYRREIATLKRQLREQEKKISFLEAEALARLQVLTAGEGRKAARGRKGTRKASRRSELPLVDEHRSSIAETAVLSEPALAKDWNRPEEDAAWSHLQQEQSS